LFDSEILESSKLYSVEATRLYILSDLFDTFFLHFLNLHTAKGIDAFTTKESRENDHILGVEKMTEIGSILKDNIAFSEAILRLPFHSSRCTEGSTADLAVAVETLVNIRLLLSHIALKTRTQPSIETDTSPSESTQGNIDIDTVTSANTSGTLDNTTPSTLEPPSPSASASAVPMDRKQHDYSCDFGLIETASLVYVLRSYQRGLPLPLHWVRALGLKQCLLLVSQGETIVLRS
jgi:hypothetical protein